MPGEGSNRSSKQPPKSIPPLQKYRLISKKGEGTFSEVLKAQCIKNGKVHAIKCMKNVFETMEQVNNLREIQALRRLSPHPHIIKLNEVLYDQPTGRLALVFELMDMNIYELIRGRRHYLPEAKVKNFMYQLVKALDHMHRNGIFHRDIKPENILICDEQLKLADFGSCRGIYSKQPYTEYISTRWYRAPECLLTDGYYNYKMDMWGVGCVFFEIASLYPLFPGKDELDQINRIHNVLGTPPPEFLQKLKRYSSHMDLNFPPKSGTGIATLIPHVSQECIDLIQKMLAYNPDERLSARQALRHPYFRELREQDKRAQKALEQPSPSPSPVPQLLPEAVAGGNRVSQATTASSAATNTTSKTAATTNSTANAQGTQGPDEENKKQILPSIPNHRRKDKPSRLAGEGGVSGMDTSHTHTTTHHGLQGHSMQPHVSSHHTGYGSQQNSSLPPAAPKSKTTVLPSVTMPGTRRAADTQSEMSMTGTGGWKKGDASLTAGGGGPSSTAGGASSVVSGPGGGGAAGSERGAGWKKEGKSFSSKSSARSHYYSNHYKVKKEGHKQYKHKGDAPKLDFLSHHRINKATDTQQAALPTYPRPRGVQP